MDDVVKNQLATLDLALRQDLPRRLNFRLHLENGALGDSVGQRVRTVKVVNDL